MYGFGIARALTVTLKNLILPSRLFTLQQYPDRKIGPMGLAKLSQTNVFSYAFKNPKMVIKSLIGMVSVQDKLPQHPRFRGEEFSWYEERCTGCASCAKYCPLGIIRIVTDPSGESLQEGGKYGIEVFDIDIGRCMFCGLCVEACPYDALHMGSGFEEGTYKREDLVIDVEKLKSSPKRPSSFIRPQIENDEYDPRQSDDLDWNKVGRHQKPTNSELERKWAKR